MQQDIFQFYPTPPALAAKAWTMFENQNPVRVLEPSAGAGDLLAPLKDYTRRYHGRVGRVDTIELDIRHHDTLRGKGFDVVDTDFLRFRSPVCYSHIIMNPPFAKGVDHVLHAWDLLRDGELVAILNANSLNNPHTRKREHLLQLIEKHGRVEFVDEAFTDPDTLRKTSVRVALVHLVKRTRVSVSLPECMKEDARRISDDINPPQELTQPNSTIRNTVRAFNAAVEAMVDSVKAQARATYYARMIEVPISGSEDSEDDEKTHGLTDGQVSFAELADAINDRYDRLKEHAWRNVLQATDFTSRFSSKVRNDIEAQLSRLIKMEFTEENVHSLLAGLLQSKTELDYQMIEEAFDLICRYHSDNREYYRGWKSNDKHRLAWKMRSTRFILPNMATSYTRDLSYDAENTLNDLDRAFSLLDGKHEASLSMSQIARARRCELLSSQRLETEYFDIRFYPKAGTLHFFPRRKDLVERLNRIIGRRRKWIPGHPSDAFWKQYEAAKKATKVMNKYLPVKYWGRYSDEDMEEAHAKACAELGIELALPFTADAEVDQLALPGFQKNAA